MEAGGNVAEHPITPPEATVLSLRNSAPHGIGDFGATRELWLINHAYAAGADQELEACCEWLRKDDDAYQLVGLRAVYLDHELHAARRPNPPSLNSIALRMLGTIERDARYLPEITDTIRRALEQLDG